MRRVPWTRQPPYPVGIDWSNPIAKFLEFAYLGNKVVLSSSKNKGFPDEFVAKTKPGKHGISSCFGSVGGGTGDYINAGKTNAVENRTCFALFKAVSTGGGGLGRIYEAIESGSGYREFFYISIGGGLSYLRDSSSGGFDWICSTAIPINTWMNAACVWELGVPNAAWYYDGNPLSGSSGAPYTGAAFNKIKSQITIGNRLSDKARNFDGEIALVLIFNAALSSAEIKSISENPWQVFEPYTVFGMSPTYVVSAQYARPTSDASAGTWTASSGSDLYAMLDETTANDADYITTVSASTCEVALGSITDPAVSTGHIVRYRLSSDAGGITVRLRQGTTTIATWTHAPAPAPLTLYEQTLSSGEANSITDYTALRLQFEATE